MKNKTKLRLRPNVELFMRRTKLLIGSSVWSDVKLRTPRTNQLNQISDEFLSNEAKCVIIQIFNLLFWLSQVKIDVHPVDDLQTFSPSEVAGRELINDSFPWGGGNPI